MMTKCPYCKEALLLVEYAIVRYIGSREVVGIDISGGLQYGEEDMGEILDSEVTKYICSHCDRPIFNNEEEIIDYLEEHPEYQNLDYVEENNAKD